MTVYRTAGNFAREEFRQMQLQSIAENIHPFYFRAHASKVLISFNAQAVIIKSESQKRTYLRLKIVRDCCHCLHLSITSSKIRGSAVVSSLRAGSEASSRRSIASFADHCRERAL